MHRYAFASALSHENRQHACLPYQSEVLSPEKIRATTGGIASPPSLAPRQPFQNRTIPRKSPTHLPPLSKVRCCRLKKFGRLPEGLLHHPSHNYNKPLLRHHTSQRRQLTRIGKHKKNPHCLFWQWGFGLVYRFYFKYLPTSTAGAEVSGAGLPEQSSVYPPTEIPVISPLPSSVSV